MTIKFRKNLLQLSDVISVEDAEPLLAGLQGKVSPRVDLSKCTHLHPANLQVLLAAGVTVHSWPEDLGLTMWLKTILHT